MRLAVYDRLLEAASAVPGVQSASTISLLPFGGGGQVNFIVPEGKILPRSEQASANFRFVAPDYFETVGISLLRGRSFRHAEREREHLPSVVSEATAKHLWPGEEPIGKRFSRGIDGEAGFEVVGVTVDARTTSVEREAPLMVYLPYWWRTRNATSIVLKTASEPEAVVASVRRAIGHVDPDIAIGQTRTLSALVDRSLASRRYQAALFVVFGVVALFITTIGVYAVTAYAVSHRKREMNIRAALGAQKSEVLGMVVRQSSLPIVAGGVAGTAGALALGGTISGLLYGIAPTDSGVITAVVALVTLVGLSAAMLAARQNVSIDPAAALREQ
jgi:predicted permease